MIEEEGGWMTRRAAGLAVKQLFASQFAFRRLIRDQSALDVQFRCRGKVQHVLHLGHMRYLDAAQFHKALLHGMDGIAVEIGRALLKLGKIFNRP